ncbi:ABC transporter ATP-binding protein [Peptoniphilus duerdenii]|uniref:ABC transporter ATP-binding protein n=1 Tax=Peptoniphilus duerdenii TaxID=507750 RepID=UPI0023F5512C|nr:ABC transporter ATP-binding protein [Peptoniphilus duerdenii]
MFKFYRDVREHFIKYKKNYILAVICLAIVDFIAVLPPKIISNVADRINASTLDVDFLKNNTIYLVIITIGSYLIGLVWTKNLWVTSDFYGRDIKTKLYNKILSSTGRFFETHTTGELMTNLTSDQGFVRDAISFGVLALFEGAIYPLFVIVMMVMSSNLKLSTMSIIPMLLIIPIIYCISQKIEHQYTYVQEKNSKINDAVLEMAQGIRVIRAYSGEENTTSSFESLTDDAFKENIKLSLYERSYGLFANFIPAFSYFICLYYGSAMLKDGAITLGNIVSLQIYLGMLVWPMMAIAEFFSAVALGKAGVNRINSALNFVDDITYRDGDKSLDRIKKISYRNLNFKYPTSEELNLKNINVEIKRGMTLGIVGRTGSGKTTFIKQMLRDYKLDNEMLFINDVPIEDYKMDDVFRKIAYVPQESVLFSKSIRENILFARSDATEADLDEALEITDLKRDINSFNEGLETLAGEKGISLSGGQKQRIAIARAIIADRELLILDDSLSAVDSNTEKKIISHINEKRKGRTNIIVSHRLSAVENADLIIVLDHGEIVERGTHEELMATVGWYSEQYNYQVSGGNKNED